MDFYVSIITSTDIHVRFDEAANELERDNQIRFPDSKARADFIEDCVRSKIDKFELYDSDPFNHQTKHVYDFAFFATMETYSTGTSYKGAASGRCSSKTKPYFFR